MACRREPSATRGTRCAVATHPLRPAPRHGYVSRREVTGTARGPSRKGALAQRQLRRHAAADGSSAEGQPSLEDPRADAGHYSQNADAGRSTLDAEDPVRDVLRNPFCRLEVYVVRGVRERPSRLIKMKLCPRRIRPSAFWGGDARIMSARSRALAGSLPSKYISPSLSWASRVYESNSTVLVNSTNAACRLGRPPIFY